MVNLIVLLPSGMARLPKQNILQYTRICQAECAENKMRHPPVDEYVGILMTAGTKGIICSQFSISISKKSNALQSSSREAGGPSTSLRFGTKKPTETYLRVL